MVPIPRTRKARPTRPTGSARGLAKTGTWRPSHRGLAQPPYQGDGDAEVHYGHEQVEGGLVGESIGLLGVPAGGEPEG